MIRRPPRSTQSRSSAASDVYKRQSEGNSLGIDEKMELLEELVDADIDPKILMPGTGSLSLIHISEPTRLLSISYAVFCLKKKKENKKEAEKALQRRNQERKKKNMNTTQNIVHNHII